MLSDVRQKKMFHTCLIRASKGKQRKRKSKRDIIGILMAFPTALSACSTVFQTLGESFYPTISPSFQGLTLTLPFIYVFTLYITMSHSHPALHLFGEKPAYKAENSQVLQGIIFRYLTNRKIDYIHKTLDLHAMWQEQKSFI